MNRIFRLLSLTTLCLALVAGSLSMAVARGQAVAMTKGGTTLVICMGTGVKTITLDDQGNPIGPSHPCPECLAGLAAYLPPGLPALLPIMLPSQSVVVFGPAASPRAAGVLITRARGPPLVG